MGMVSPCCQPQKSCSQSSSDVDVRKEGGRDGSISRSFLGTSFLDDPTQ